jgi:hypothetical protein
MSDLKRGAAVKLRAWKELSKIKWPVCCVLRVDLEGLENEHATVITSGPACEFSGDETHTTKNIQVAAIVWDDAADEIVNAEADGMPKVVAWLVPVAALRLVEANDG